MKHKTYSSWEHLFLFTCIGEWNGDDHHVVEKSFFQGIWHFFDPPVNSGHNSIHNFSSTTKCWQFHPTRLNAKHTNATIDSATNVGSVFSSSPPIFTDIDRHPISSALILNVRLREHYTFAILYGQRCIMNCSVSEDIYTHSKREQKKNQMSLSC